MAVDDFHFPAVARDSDGAHLADVFHPQMHRAGPDGFAQTVVGIVLVIREVLQPPVDQALGHGLGADMHQPPLGQFIVPDVQLPAVQGGQDILGPGNQQPYDGAVFLADGLEDGFRPGPFQDHRLSAGDQAAEPVHFGPGMIQGRDAEEAVLLRLAVVRLLHPGGVNQAPVLMQDCFGKPRGAGREVNGRVVLLRQLAGREDGAAFVDQLVQVIREGGAAGAQVHQGNMGDRVGNFLYPADEFRPEDHHGAFGQVQAVFDFAGGVAEIHGHRQRPGFHDAEINGQPVDAVHQQDRHFAAGADAVGFQHVGHPVCFFVKDGPGDFPPVMPGADAGLHQFEFMPGDPAGLRLIGVDFHKGRVIRPFPCIPFQ